MDVLTGECTDLLSSLLPSSSSPSGSPEPGSGLGLRGSPNVSGTPDPQSTRVTPTTSSTGGAIGSAALDAFSSALSLGGAVTMMGGITGGGGGRATGTLCFPLSGESEGRMLTNKEAVSLILGSGSGSGSGQGDTKSIRWSGTPEEISKLFTPSAFLTPSTPSPSRAYSTYKYFSTPFLHIHDG